MKVESVCDGGTAPTAMGPARVRGALRLSRVMSDGKCIVEMYGNLQDLLLVSWGMRRDVEYLLYTSPGELLARLSIARSTLMPSGDSNGTIQALPGERRSPASPSSSRALE